MFSILPRHHHGILTQNDQFYAKNLAETVMTEQRIGIIIVLAFSVLTVIADILIKRASDKSQLLSISFAVGALIYGLSAFGWFYALKSLKLATLGGIYSLTTVVLIVLSGVVFFGERLNTAEYAVVVMSLISIAALWRYL